MSRTITAMFDSREEAEAARSRLQESRIDASRIRILDRSSGADAGGLSGSAPGSTSGASATSGDNGGFWSTLRDMFMPDEDRHTYGEAINRGHYMIAADVDENEADEAIRILESSSSVDLDQRSGEWRQQGWGGRYEQGFEANDRQSGAFGPIGDDHDQLATGGAGMGERTSGVGLGSDRAMDRDRTVEEERIPVVEEQLRVGKREVSRGGARVRSYVREVPVHEDVTLHSEHVSVERRPVNETVARDRRGNDELFRDREIEMTERSEEAVVGKEAVVREEVVLRKTADDRVEGIDDTVRRTEVDVDEDGGRNEGDRSAFFGKDRDRDGIRDDAERARDPSLGRRDS